MGCNCLCSCDNNMGIEIFLVSCNFTWLVGLSTGSVCLPEGSIASLRESIAALPT